MQFKKLITIFLILIHSGLIAGINRSKNIDNVNQLDSAKFYYTQGVDLGRNGKLDSALIFSEKSIELNKRFDEIDSLLLANSYQSLGIINKLLGKYNRALKYYDHAEIIYRKYKKFNLVAYIYSNKANIFSRDQNYDKAKDFYNQAIYILSRDSTEYKRQIAIAYNNLGIIYYNEGKIQEAIINFEQSLKLKGEKDFAYPAVGNLARCYAKLNKPEKAEQYYLKTIQMASRYYKDSANLNIAVHYLNYANFLAQQNRTKEALKYINRTLDIYIKNLGNKHPRLSVCYNDLGNIYLNNNDLDSALKYFQKSLIAIAPDFNDIDINSNPEISNVLSKTHLLKSLKNKANVLAEMASVNQNIDYLKLSVSTYDLALETINKIRSGYLSEESKLFLADNEFETFSDALQTCYKLYKLTNEKEYIEKLFNYSEAGKSAILTEALKTSNALNIGGIPDSLITKEKELEKSIWNYEELIYEENKKKNPDNNKLGYWNKYLFEKKQAYDDLSKYLENNFTKYHTLKHSQYSIKISDIQHNLSSKDLLVEYFFADHKIYIFLIGKNSYEVYKQVITTSFHDNLDSLLMALSNNNFSNHGYKEFTQYQKNSYFVYTKLLKPFEKQIENKNLIIIPDGKLAYLPFEVLTSNNKPFKRINYKHLPYLLYKHRFIYSYSASFLYENRSTNQIASKKLGAFAPTYTNLDSLPSKNLTFRQEYREKLFPLKGIKVEVQEIATLLHGDQYLDKDANERTFKKVAADYDILHLAMHTIMDDKNPMYSKMAFTQDNDTIEDGFLNTYELYNMKLNSRMAVLSSCNSGSGKLHRGEGVMSLARGFIYSGCPSIIMTLWSVEDKSGVKLMTSFYKNLLKGETKSEALQQSKIEFIQHADQLKSHPYFWSGYVVIGNDSALFTSLLKITILIVCGVLIMSLIIFRRKIKKLF